jgi:hypothetical protein
MNRHRLRAPALLLVPALLLTFAGCDQQRLDQFSTFATAGSQYVQAFHKFIAAAGSASIAANSAVLSTARIDAAKGHQSLPASAVIDADKDLAQTLANLGTIDEHASALGSYFDAVTKLSDNKLNASMKSSADGLMTAMGELSSKVKDLKIEGKPVNNYVKSATDLIVAHFEVKALNDHLKIAAPKIDEALMLQQAAIDCIGEVMKADLMAALENQENTRVIAPFTASGDLPDSWNADREAYLRAKVTIDNVESAQSAIKQLRQAFQQLVTAKASPNLGSILRDIEKMAEYASAVESSKAFATTTPQKTGQK